MFARSYGQTPGIIQGQMDRGPQGSFGTPANDLGGFGMPAPMEQPQTFPAPSQPMNNLRPQAQRPNQNRYDKFAEAMMQARGRRGMGGRPMAKPMLGGMGGPMTRPQAPRGGMQQSPPIVPQQMTNDLQSAVQGLQQKPGRLTQPGSPVLTAPAGFGAQ
ncbi:MAG: hypothetical protein IPK75_18510 [Acidobacteria bacterium]|nr:hypothetical protein [Acidobacteriota bacterium]